MHQFPPEQLRALAEFLREDVETDAKTLSRLHWAAEAFEFAAQRLDCGPNHDCMSTNTTEETT